jgi:hypothetical protein
MTVETKIAFPFAAFNDCTEEIKDMATRGLIAIAIMEYIGSGGKISDKVTAAIKGNEQAQLILSLLKPGMEKQLTFTARARKGATARHAKA